MMCLGVGLCIHLVWDSLCFLDLHVYFLHQIREAFFHYFSFLKKILTLVKIKNNLQGNNCTVNEAENRINDLEYKEAKNNQSEQEEEKRIQENENRINSPGATSRSPIFTS